MIEVEKKFILNKEQKARIERLAEFVCKKVFTDIYFDDKKRSLTSNDIWLRRRGKKFELKIPAISKKAGKRVNSYKEIQKESEIIKVLRLNTGRKNLSEWDLKKNGYLRFCKIVTNRKKYRLKRFNIDVDKTDFGYSLCEIEKMIRNRGEVKKTGDTIIRIGRELGLKVQWGIRGKVLEYLWRYDKKHYNKLKRSKVIL